MRVGRISVAHRVRKPLHFVSLYRIEDAAGHRWQLTVGYWRVKW